MGDSASKGVDMATMTQSPAVFGMSPAQRKKRPWYKNVLSDVGGTMSRALGVFSLPKRGASSGDRPRFRFNTPKGQPVFSTDNLDGINPAVFDVNNASPIDSYIQAQAGPVDGRVLRALDMTRPRGAPAMTPTVRAFERVPNASDMARIVEANGPFNPNAAAATPEPPQAAAPAAPAPWSKEFRNGNSYGYVGAQRGQPDQAPGADWVTRQTKSGGTVQMPPETARVAVFNPQAGQGDGYGPGATPTGVAIMDRMNPNKAAPGARDEFEARQRDILARGGQSFVASEAKNRARAERLAVFTPQVQAAQAQAQGAYQSALARGASEAQAQEAAVAAQAQRDKTLHGYTMDQAKFEAENRPPKAAETPFKPTILTDEEPVMDTGWFGSKTATGDTVKKQRIVPFDARSGSSGQGAPTSSTANDEAYQGAIERGATDEQARNYSAAARGARKPAVQAGPDISGYTVGGAAVGPFKDVQGLIVETLRRNEGMSAQDAINELVRIGLLNAA